MSIPFDWITNYYQNRLIMTLKSKLFNININTDFYVNVEKNTLNKLPDILEWNIPRISISNLHEFIIAAAHIYKLYKSECAALFLYNIKTSKYQLFYPEQEISGGSVHYDMESININPHFIIVADIHSHHDMKISFSATDDRSDKSLGILPHLSIVFKNISSCNMLDLSNNIDCRITVQRISYNLKMDDCFINDFGFCEKSFIDKTFHHNVEKSKTVTVPKNMFEFEYPHKYM